MLSGADSAQGRPRKFTIQSQFGRARLPRSRKNRPCDACRRRKTACVIPSEPPCKSGLSSLPVVALPGPLHPSGVRCLPLLELEPSRRASPRVDKVCCACRLRVMVCGMWIVDDGHASHLTPHSMPRCNISSP